MFVGSRLIRRALWAHVEREWPNIVPQLPRDASKESNDMTVTAPTPISGTCDPAFSSVRDEFERNFRERGEVGAAVCVYRGGKPVVDLWGGYKDLDRTVPWEKDTIVIMNSVAKSMCAICMHILIDRGLVDFDAPVARYWPEFGAAGKEGVLVRHVLSHTCGV